MNTFIENMREDFGMRANQTKSASKGIVWTGRIISALVVLFMLLDGVMKLIKPAPVLQATARLGFPESRMITAASLGDIVEQCC